MQGEQTTLTKDYRPPSVVFASELEWAKAKVDLLFSLNKEKLLVVRTATCLRKKKPIHNMCKTFEKNAMLPEQSRRRFCFKPVAVI